MQVPIDLRGLPVWERPDLILTEFDTLAPGESLTLITENEPRGLYGRIEFSRQHQVIFDPTRVGESEWHIRLTRAELINGVPAPAAVFHRALAFRGIQPESIAHLAAAASVHVARRGQSVAREHTDWPHVGIVVEGALALSNGENDGRSRLFYEIFPYEIFGEAGFFDGSPMHDRVIVLSKTARYITVPVAELRAVGNADTALILGIGRVLAQRSRDAHAELGRLATMPIIGRIARVLLGYAVPDKGLSAAMAPLPNMTQSQIAAAAGTVKEVAARAIAQLETKGLLKREHGHVSYLDRQGLADLVRELS